MRSSAQNQQKILDFIKSEIDLKGYPPSVREICAAVGLKSTSTVHAHLNSLEKQGLIRRDSTKPRALEVLDGSLQRGRSVPLIGRVTAGQPILAVASHCPYMTMNFWPLASAASANFLCSSGVSLPPACVI